MDKHIDTFQSNICKIIIFTTQKLKFSIKDFFSKWRTPLLKKSLMENLIFCAVFIYHFGKLLVKGWSYPKIHSNHHSNSSFRKEASLRDLSFDKLPFLFGWLHAPLEIRNFALHPMLSWVVVTGGGGSLGQSSSALWKIEANSGGVLKKTCSNKFRKIHGKRPVPEPFLKMHSQVWDNFWQLKAL